jgi:hypothetical protein
MDEFNAAMNRVMRETRRTASDVVEQQSRLTVRDVMKFTPPTGNAPVTEGWPAQKQAGENAIRNDFSRGFQPARDWEAWKNIFQNHRKLELFKNYFNQRRWTAIQTVMRRMNLRFTLLVKANTQAHQRIRNRRGRIRNNKGYLVFDVNSVFTLLNKKLKNVGMAKSGWVQAATELGVPIPPWIRRHFQPGEIVIDLYETDNPTVYFSNLSRHANEIEAGLSGSERIVQRAINRRAESMEHQMNAMLGIQFDGYKY